MLVRYFEAGTHALKLPLAAAGSPNAMLPGAMQVCLSGIPRLRTQLTLGGYRTRAHTHVSRLAWEGCVGLAGTFSSFLWGAVRSVAGYCNFIATFGRVSPVETTGRR